MTNHQTVSPRVRVTLCSQEPCLGNSTPELGDLLRMGKGAVSHSNSFWLVLICTSLITTGDEHSLLRYFLSWYFLWWMSAQVFCPFSEIESFSPLLWSRESLLLLISVYTQLTTGWDSFIRYICGQGVLSSTVFSLPLKCLLKSKRILF